MRRKPGKRNDPTSRFQVVVDGILGGVDWKDHDSVKGALHKLKAIQKEIEETRDAHQKIVNNLGVLLMGLAGKIEALRREVMDPLGEASDANRSLWATTLGRR